MVSVLFPLYNTKEYCLREFIESILAQTYSNFEFLIVNDGSTEVHIERMMICVMMTVSDTIHVKHRVLHLSSIWVFVFHEENILQEWTLMI